MIEQIISDYMAHNRRLVIPTLGAFLKKEGEGKLVFVEFLKSNDGVLAGLVQKDMSLSVAEAKTVIEQYVLRIKQQIASKGEFVIDHLGIMRVDANNLYNFEYSPSVSAMIQSPKPTEQASQPQQQPQMPQSRQSQPPVRAVVLQSVEESAKMPAATPAVEAPLRPNPIAQRTIVSAEQPIEKKPVATKPVDAVKGLRYQKPAVAPFASQSKKRADTIMIIAIVAAALAIIAMVYGIFANSGSELKLRDDAPRQIEQPVEQTAPETGK